MIPDDQVEEVRLRADIVDVISDYVPLKKSGKDYKARCPFHEERTPSFYVVPSKGFYNCFGCGASGDVFSFLMKKGGLEFVEAVRHVAGKVGIELRETRQGDEARDDPNRPLYEVNAFARAFYAERLADPEEGRDARDYLTSRGVDDAIVERFGLGYAPDDWRALRDAAAVHGFDDDLLMEVGLLSTSEKAPEPYDRFRHRVVFPIEELGGRVVAFGARVLGKGDKGPKYLNSPETPVYHKGDVLYGLSWARHNIRREGAVMVVEGYMDLVSLAAAGFDNVVAPLGTSMTEEQARLLGRYTKRVFLLFDSDRAGLEATFRAGDVLLAAGLSPAVVTLPPGEDPDTVVRKEGRPALQGYLEDAVDVLDRKLQILEREGYLDRIEGRRRGIDGVLSTLRAARDPALRDIY
ncbi:MAG: DNA primase, partial [Gemmatimonadetes bacterium]|nr:DNA primase [Gemmatimonadota bacterium]